jgi:hypothetical protein
VLSQTLATEKQLQRRLQHFMPDSSTVEACHSRSYECTTAGLDGMGPLADEAEPPVIAFAAAAAALLLCHIAEHVPAELSSALSHQLKQQVTNLALEAAAAGRPFTVTAALQQLLPQLSALAAQATYRSSLLAAAAAVAMPAGSSTGGAGQLTRMDLSAQHSASSPSQQRQPIGSPILAQHSAAHASVGTAFIHSGCASLPAAAAAASTEASTGILSLLQEQQDVCDAELVPILASGVYAAADAPQGSECGSTL